jgi:hypothetical protein
MIKDPKHQEHAAPPTTTEPDPDNNLGRGAPADRNERVKQIREERPEHRGRSEGEAHKQWERKPDDLDRENAAIQREGAAGEKPGVRPKGDADFVRDKG